MIKKKEFTQWWFHKLSMGLRSRHNYLSNNDILEIIELKPLWTNCIGKNKSKVELIYQGKRQVFPKSQSDWLYCISWQKKKIARNNDELDLWRKTESKLLERMNNNNFKRNLSPNNIWNFHVYLQCMKVNKLYSKTFLKNIPEKWEWKHVIKRARQRYNKKYFEIYQNPDDLWTLNIKANKLKVNTIHIRNDWGQCIFRNLDKMRYRYHNHSKKKDNTYKHSEFR